MFTGLSSTTRTVDGDVARGGTGKPELLGTLALYLHLQRFRKVGQRCKVKRRSQPRDLTGEFCLVRTSLSKFNGNRIKISDISNRSGFLDPLADFTQRAIVWNQAIGASLGLRTRS